MLAKSALFTLGPLSGKTGDKKFATKFLHVMGFYSLVKAGRHLEGWSSGRLVRKSNGKLKMFLVWTTRSGNQKNRTIVAPFQIKRLHLADRYVAMPWVTYDM